MAKTRQTTQDSQLRVIVPALAVLTCAVYWRVVSYPFINFDDVAYVVNNPHVKGGLSLSNLAWAFNVGYCSNWHPLTWMSHMTDYAVFGSKAGGHHAVNLLLHTANAILLFLLLHRLTRSQWKSAFVAALFAVHPLHVESVAWIAERKDVLSALFWLLTTWAYVRYTEKPGVRRYVPVFVLFALGLMAKPMLVTLPVVLLLLDFWPLRRLQTEDNRPQEGLGRLIVEKMPLLMLAAMSSVFTFLAQSKGASVSSLGTLAPILRIENAIVSYAAYLVKMVWPSGLAPFYPFPMHMIPAWKIAGAALALCAISGLVYRYRKTASYLVFGWLWYLVTLLPVIGIVQVGSQAMADRYTYIPLVGVFIMVAWGVPECVGVWGHGRKGDSKPHSSHPPTNAQHPTPTTALSMAACLVIVALSACAFRQVGYWRDSIALFRHTIAVTDGNYTAYANLASAYAEKKDYRTAEPYYAKAVKYRPDMPSLHFDYGNALYVLGKVDQAIEEYQRTLELNPNDEEAANNLKAIELKRRNAARAREILQQSGRKGADAITHLNRAVVLDGEGKAAEAEREYREAIRLNPKFAEAHSNLGVLLRNKGDLDGAIAEYRKAIEFKPGLVEAHNNLAITYYFKGDYAEAWSEVYECYRLGYQPAPDFVQTLARKMPDPGR